MNSASKTALFLEDILQDIYTREELPSLTALLCRRGQTIWAKSLGFADLGSERPADYRTSYHLGSLTKVFTALWLLQLRDEGILQLEDLLAKFLPEVRASGLPAINLRQLASHTAGLPLMPPLPSLTAAMQEFPPQMETLENLHFPTMPEILDTLPQVRLDSPPGKRVEYSNLGIALLAEALQRAAGLEYTSAVQDRILGPLGMQDSGFTEQIAGSQNAAVCYLPFFDTPRAAPFQTKRIGGFTPAGALWASTADLAHILAFLTGPENASATPVLSRRSLLEMTQVVAPLESSRYTGAKGQAGVGIGWFLSEIEGRKLAEHGGADPSTSAYLGWLPNSGLAVFLATNSGKNPNAIAVAGAAMLEIALQEIQESN